MKKKKKKNQSYIGVAEEAICNLIFTSGNPTSRPVNIARAEKDCRGWMDDDYVKVDLHANPRMDINLHHRRNQLCQKLSADEGTRVLDFHIKTDMLMQGCDGELISGVSLQRSWQVTCGLFFLSSLSWLSEREYFSTVQMKMEYLSEFCLLVTPEWQQFLV